MFDGLVYLTKAMKKKLRDFIFQELVFVDEPEQFSDDDNLLEAGLDCMGIMRLIMFKVEPFFCFNPRARGGRDGIIRIT